jgi:hypothetical protein
VESSSFVGLAEVIEQIRAELEQARAASEGKAIGFTVDKVSVEFTVEVRREGTAGGGLRIGVVTANVGGSTDRGTTHRIQVDLQPHMESGRLSVGR